MFTVCYHRYKKQFWQMKLMQININSGLQNWVACTWRGGWSWTSLGTETRVDLPEAPTEPEPEGMCVKRWGSAGLRLPEQRKTRNTATICWCTYKSLCEYLFSYLWVCLLLGQGGRYKAWLAWKDMTIQIQWGYGITYNREKNQTAFSFALEDWAFIKKERGISAHQRPSAFFWVGKITFF